MSVARQLIPFDLRKSVSLLICDAYSCVCVCVCVFVCVCVHVSKQAVMADSTYSFLGGLMSKVPDMHTANDDDHDTTGRTQPLHLPSQLHHSHQHQQQSPHVDVGIAPKRRGRCVLKSDASLQDETSC